MQTFEQLVSAFEDAKRDPAFWAEYLQLVASYSGRPTPLTFAGSLTGISAAHRSTSSART